MRLQAVATAFLGLGAGVAGAHIHLTNPKSRIDTEIGDDQKFEHCGVTGQVRQPDRVTTLKPGQKITVTWKETFPHTGYYRIAFQPNGDTFHIPPVGPGPQGFPTENLTGMIHAGTGAHILADRIPDGSLSWMVTLPAMECNNCTLQFIQVMTDKQPYTVDPLSDDIYFNCADLTLSNSAPEPVDPPPGGMPDGGIPDDASNSGGKINGGCTAVGGGGWLVALAVGLVARRRRARP